MTDITKNQKNTPTPPKTATTAKGNPFDGMAEKLEAQMADSLPASFQPNELRTLDPAYTLGRQMLALDDLFQESLEKFHKSKGKPHNNAYGFMLPVALKIQQSCLSTARTMSAIDYMEHLQTASLKRNAHPLPPPPHTGKQTEFDHEQ